MWLSPSDDTGEGIRYKLADISALIYPLDMLLDWVERSGAEHTFGEPILRGMRNSEAVYALFELFQALLEDIPAPDDGHPGYLEAMIAELLDQMHGRIVAELDFPDEDDSARQAAWNSFLCFANDSDEEGRPYVESWMVARGISPVDPFPYRSPNLTADDWEDLLFQIRDGEFLQDNDWQLEGMLDLPEERTEGVRELLGLDLDRAHRLPHTPNRAELNMATFYLKYLIWKDEVAMSSGE